MSSPYSRLQLTPASSNRDQNFVRWYLCKTHSSTGLRSIFSLHTGTKGLKSLLTQAYQRVHNIRNIRDTAKYSTLKCVCTQQAKGGNQYWNPHPQKFLTPASRRSIASLGVWILYRACRRGCQPWPTNPTNSHP